MWKSLLTVFFLTAVVVSDTQPSVTNELGTIYGEKVSLRIHGVDYSVKTFLGVPYAFPPVGDRRFKKTELLTRLPDEFNATNYGPACSQLSGPIQTHHFKAQSEDCLSLNIYVPDAMSNETQGFAVMVYIHGGGFMFDAAEMFSGDVISALNEVIVVIINYRVGVFGFLSLGIQGGMGNLGLWDQHIALQWINKYIGDFGGDNSRVTVFGESSGGQCTIYQALFHQNDGLFQRFISESGNPSIFPHSNLSFKFAADAKAQMEYISDKLGCQSTSLYDTVSCLQSDTLNTSTIMKTLQDLMSNVLSQPLLIFAPTIDGEIIKTNPSNLKDMADSHNVDDFNFYRSLDMLTGFNNKEGALFALLLLPDVEQFRPTLNEFYKVHLPTALTFSSLSQSPVVREIIGAEYTDWNAKDDDVAAVQKQYLELYQDIAYSIGTLSFAKFHENPPGPGSTFVYRFSASPTNHVVSVPSWVQGANHGDELPFVFGFSKEMETTLFRNGTYQNPTDWEVELSYEVMRYWTNFAKTGDPNRPIPVTPAWPKYNTHQEYIELEANMTTASIKRFLLSDKLDFWLNVYPAVVKSTQENENCAAP